MRPNLRHVPVLAGFAALTIAWLWPVLRQPMEVIPGPGAGDNLTFVWNTWWMRHALANGQSPLWTSMLFAPSGTGLALNTHFALPALAGAAAAPLLRRIRRRGHQPDRRPESVPELRRRLRAGVPDHAERAGGVHRRVRVRMLAVHRRPSAGTFQPDRGMGAAAVRAGDAEGPRAWDESAVRPGGPDLGLAGVRGLLLHHLFRARRRPGGRVTVDRNPAVGPAAANVAAPRARPARFAVPPRSRRDR